MRTILFYISLFGGCITLMAQDRKDNPVESNVLFEQAVKALEQKKFIVRFNTMDYRSQRRKHLDNETNFLILEDDSIFYQYDDGRREYRLHGSEFYMAPDVKKGKVEDLKISKDKKDNLKLNMSTKGKGRHSSYTIKIVLEKGSNNCVATIKDYWGNHYYTGTLYPIDATTVMKAN